MTADMISLQTGAQIIQRSDLRERSLGVLQGLTYDEAKRQEPEAWRCLHAHDSSVAIPGGGESLMDLDARIAGALEDIAGQHPGECVVVVSHGGALHAAHRRATGHDCSGGIANCSISRIKVEGSSWAVLAWNDTSHLQEVGVSARTSGGGRRDG